MASYPRRRVPSWVLCLAASVPTAAMAEGPRPSPSSEHPPARISDRLRGQDIAATSPPLKDPPRRSVAAATHMRDEDLVFGLVLAGQARAYPWWIAKNHHVVDDTIAGVPIAVAFCEQCTGGAAFRRQIEGRTLTFEVAGVYNGTIVLRDRETRSLWAPFTGTAIEGPLAGRKLDRVPLLLSHWDEWAERHPETEVIWDSERSRAGHGSWYARGKWGILTEMGATLQGWDPRLPENTLVYGVAGAHAAKSYPLALVQSQRLVNDDVGGTSVVIVALGLVGVAGYERTLGDRLLTFRPSLGPEAVMSDLETASQWSAEGLATSGPLRGQRLRPADGYFVEWHVWSAYNPKAEVFGEAVAAPPTVSDEGLTFPSFALPRLDGDGFSSLPLAGEVNLVALWAAWCAPCRVEMPLVERLVKEHAGEGLSAVGIAIHLPEETEWRAARAFVAEAGLSFPNFVVDEPAYDQLESVSRALGGRGVVLPMVFVIDRQRRILSVVSGNDVDRLPRAVKDALRRRVVSEGWPVGP